MIISAALLALSLVSSAPQPLDPLIPDVSTNLAGDGVGVEGDASDGANTRKTTSPKRNRVAPKPRQRRLVPTCPGNTPEAMSDSLCTAALAPCANVEGGSYRAWLYELTPIVVGKTTQLRWVPIRAYCVDHDEAERAGTPVLSVREFRRLPLPAGDMHIQPGSGPVLINIPTNVYVRAQPIRLHTRVVGVDVEVEATPTTFTWTFGDGGTLVTRDHGDPYPDMRTTHTYLHPGKWPVTLTTTYTGRYRRGDVPGSPWLPVNGTAQVPSPSVTLDVIETRAVLVP